MQAQQNFNSTGPSTFLGETTTKIDFEGFKEKLLRRTKSQTTVDTYMHGVQRFEAFCKERLNQSLEDAVSDLVAGRADVYQVLDRFVGWVAGQTDERTGTPLMPRTAHTYVEGTKKLLRFCGVRIIVEELKEKVTLPMTSEIPDVPIEKQTLRKLLLSGMPLSMRTAIGIMSSGGTRIGETLQLLVSDIHLDEDPVRIHLRAPTTKATKQGRFDRDTFVTAEATDFIRQLIVNRKLQTADRLFPKSYTPVGFRAELKDQLVKMGMAQKIEGHKYYQIHPHVFRKFFSRNADTAMGPTACHAMMGHGDYLQVYFRKPLHERQDDYRKAIPVLSVLQATGEEEQQLRTVLTTLRAMGLSAEQVKKWESELRQKHLFELTDEMMTRIRDELAGAWGLKAPERRLQNAGVW